MTPLGIVDRAAMPALSAPGGLGPSSVPGQNQADIFLVSDHERTDSVVVAQASPPGAAAPASTVDGPVVEVGGAGRNNRNGQSSAVGETVLRYMEALHESGRRTREKAPVAADAGVRLVVATEPGPAAAALAPPGQASPQQAADDGFEANLRAVKQLQEYAISVNLAANAVSAATGAIKTLTERMG
jgi:hypothetical protein